VTGNNRVVAGNEPRPQCEVMIHRFLCIVIALVALVATSALFHALFPPAIPAGVAAKRNFFAEHKDEFDTLFIGTSRIFYAVSPEIFDKATREDGVPTRTFNFGIDGMHPPENFYVIEQILKTNPRKLKWVFMETENIQAKWTEEIRGTQRLLYWHDWRRTALTIRKALNPRGGAAWYGKIARLWLARRDLALNLALFGRQFSNVGRAVDWYSFSDRSRDADLQLGPKHDGYRLPNAAMSPEHATRFQQQLANQASGARSKFIDPYAEKAYRDCAVQIRKLGAVPIFIVTPIIWQSPLRFRSPPGPLLLFNDSKTYPQLYDTNVRVDEGHLTRPGAEEFTRLLAWEFVRQVRQP
jgi:hypothetical protein